MSLDLYTHSPALPYGDPVEMGVEWVSFFGRENNLTGKKNIKSYTLDLIL